MRSASSPVPLKNVAGFMAMTRRLIDREPHLPGFAVCHSPSGFGKSWASLFVQNRLGALRIEVGDSWTRRTLIAAILGELGRPPKNPHRVTLAEMSLEATTALGDDASRPLIIDEADKLVDKGMIEIVRELQEHSGAPVILIGEEKLPTKLLAHERMHNRVLAWYPAQPCDVEDAAKLAEAFAPKVEIADDLLTAIVSRSDGRARRIVVNIANAVEIARNAGKKSVDLKLWGNHPWHTGEPPLPRATQPFKSTRVAA